MFELGWDLILIQKKKRGKVTWDMEKNPKIEPRYLTSVILLKIKLKNKVSQKKVNDLSCVWSFLSAGFGNGRFVEQSEANFEVSRS
jgi:hypothetical protein